MVSGVASPHALVVEPHSVVTNMSTSPLPGQSSDWNHNNHIFSAGFHRQLLNAASPQSLYGTHHHHNSSSYSSPLTPTSTTSRALQLPSPPVPPTTHRRLSLVTAAGSGMNSNNYLPGREGAPSWTDEGISSSNLPPLVGSTLPRFEPRRRIPHSNGGGTESSSTPLMMFESVADNIRVVSSNDHTSRLLSMFVSHNPPGSRGLPTLDRTGANTARNAEETIARHRSRAAQAAREAEALDDATRVAAAATAAAVLERRPAMRTRSHKRTARSPSSELSVATDAAVASDRRGCVPANAQGNRRYAISATLPQFQREFSSSTRTRDEASGLDPVTVTTIDSPASFTLPPPAKKRRTSRKSPALKKPPPGVVDFNRQTQDNEREPCAICMTESATEDISEIDGCSHRFCYDCIGKWAERENTCPLCKSRFSKISRVVKQRRTKYGKSISNTKKVKQRDQRSDIVTGAALEGLLASIASNNMTSRHIMVQHFGGAIVPLLQRQQQQNRSHMSAANRSANSFLGGPHVFASDTSSDDDDAISNFMTLFGVPRSGRQSQTDQSFATNPNGQPSSATFALSFQAPYGGASSSLGTSASVPVPNSGNHTSGSRYNPRVSFGATPHGAGNGAFHYNLRSYASNANDPSAGHASSNPLEIDDSDNSVVEIVHVDQLETDDNSLVDLLHVDL